MIGERAELWRELCEQAAKEQDPQKLLVLIGEINRLLQEKEERVKRMRAEEPAKKDDTSAA